MKHSILAIIFASFLCACDSTDDNGKDMTAPSITDNGIDACPYDCQTFRRGDEIAVCFALIDNEELGSYNIEIHHNFDHHTHSTSAVECELEDDKTAVNGWIFNDDYAIPAGLKYHVAQQFIQIPDDIDTGDYHFMIRVTDVAGWQQLRAVAIRITE